MKTVEERNANSIEVTSTCKAVEYPLDNPDINISIIYIDGRYPLEGRTVVKNIPVPSRVSRVAGGLLGFA